VQRPLKQAPDLEELAEVACAPTLS
jgi:hypothetical protein